MSTDAPVRVPTRPSPKRRRPVQRAHRRGVRALVTRDAAVGLLLLANSYKHAGSIFRWTSSLGTVDALVPDTHTSAAPPTKYIFSLGHCSSEADVKSRLTDLMGDRMIALPVHRYVVRAHWLSRQSGRENSVFNSIFHSVLRGFDPHASDPFWTSPSSLTPPYSSTPPPPVITPPVSSGVLPCDVSADSTQPVGVPADRSPSVGGRAADAADPGASRGADACAPGFVARGSRAVCAPSPGTCGSSAVHAPSPDGSGDTARADAVTGAATPRIQVYDVGARPPASPRPKLGPSVSSASRSRFHLPPASKAVQPRRYKVSTPVVPEHTLPPSALWAPYARTATTPVVVCADTAALPTALKGGVFTNMLPDHLRQLYSSPEALLLPEKERGPRVRPFTRIKSGRGEYERLVKRLMALDMVTFRDSVRAVNGIFGVPKDDGQVRVIIDARPANRFFRPAPHTPLPTPDLMARLRAHNKVAFYVGKSDLSNFYHNLRLPEWLIEYFGLPAVHSADIGLPGPDRLVHPCCLTLPMGWAHSVHVGQAVHEWLLAQVPSFSPSMLLSKHHSFELDDVVVQCYIDDLIVYCNDKHKATTLLSEYMVVCCRYGLPPKSSKIVWPTTAPVTCIGLVMFGRERLLTVDVDKAEKLVAYTLQMVRRGSATGRELGSIVGSWIWFLLVRRPLLSVFNHVFRFIERFDRERHALSPSVALELTVMCSLAPFLFAELASPFLPTIVTTDASTSGFGVMDAPCSAAEIRRFMRIHQHLLLDRGIRQNQSPPSVDLHGLSDWRVLRSGRWSSLFRLTHINQLETVTILLALHALYPHLLSKRLILCTDNMSCLGGLLKGRSSSYPQLVLLRELAVVFTLAGVVPAPFYVNTKTNPADRPSRICLAEVRPSGF